FSLMGNLLLALQNIDTLSDDASYFKNKPYVKTMLEEAKADPADRLMVPYFDPLDYPQGKVAKGTAPSMPQYMAYCRDMLLPECNIDAGVEEIFGYEAAETAGVRSLYLSCLLTRDAREGKIKAAPDSVPGESPSQKTSLDLPCSRFLQITAGK